MGREDRIHLKLSSQPGQCKHGVVSFGKNSATPPAVVPAAHAILVVSRGFWHVAGVVRPRWLFPTYREEFGYTRGYGSPVRAQFQRECGVGCAAARRGAGPGESGARVRTRRVAV